MFVVYHCSGSAGLAAVAAGIHLGYYKTDKVPCFSELSKVANALSAREGEVIALGNLGETVIGALSRGRESLLIQRTLELALGVLYPDNPIAVKGVLLSTPWEWLYNFGWFMVKRRDTARIGRWLVESALRLTYPSLCRQVSASCSK